MQNPTMNTGHQCYGCGDMTGRPNARFGFCEICEGAIKAMEPESRIVVSASLWQMFSRQQRNEIEEKKVLALRHLVVAVKEQTKGLTAAAEASCNLSERVYQAIEVFKTVYKLNLGKDDEGDRGGHRFGRN